MILLFLLLFCPLCKCVDDFVLIINQFNFLMRFNLLKVGIYITGGDFLNTVLMKVSIQIENNKKFRQSTACEKNKT